MNTRGRVAWMLLVASLALMLATVLVYRPGLGGHFIFDDLTAIVENQRLHIDVIDAANLAQAARSFEPGSGIQARPLAMASLGANHAIHGLEPRGYKVVGIGIHAANAILVFLLALQLMRVAWPGRDSFFAAFAVGAAWALHPLQVSTTLYVVQRMESMSLLFVLPALLCYIHGRRKQIRGFGGWSWILCSVPFGLLGVASKESAVLLPAYMLAIEACLLRFEAMDPRLGRMWKVAYLGGASVALIAFFVIFVPRYWVDTDSVVRGFGSAERLMTQMRILPMYLGQILWPVPSNLHFYYDHIAPSRGLLQPITTLAGGTLLLAIAASAMILRNRVPLYSLGVALFFACHLLTSNIVPLEIAFEHRNYFALFGVLLAITSLVVLLPPRQHLAYKRLVVAALIVTCGFMTFLRASVWGEPLLFATESTAHNPESSRASIELGAEYLEMTDGYTDSPFYDFAIREFERGAAIPGSSIVSDQGLILAATKAGRPIDPAWWARLQRKLREGNITPDTTQALFGLLRNRLNGIDIDDRQLIDAFLTLFNRVTMPPYSYGQVADYVLHHSDDEGLAVQLYARAVVTSESNHADLEYGRRLIDALRNSGRADLADAVIARVAQHSSSAGDANEGGPNASGTR